MSVLPGLQILSHRLSEQFRHVQSPWDGGSLQILHVVLGEFGGLNVGFGGLAP